ncbi:META domain-containing protein [uncultured Roseibium sp.]|uniref:META domain-containing protein n=1 Tax=uncultured Roseibium sp. TaxID=1936171 RepID=UPI003217D7AA
MKSFVKSIAVVSFIFAGQFAAHAEEVVLQSVQSGLFVSTQKGRLAAQSRNMGSALRLDTVQLDRNRMAFRDIRTGTYLRAGVGSEALLATGSPHIRSWETFTVIRSGRDKVLLRSIQNGKYVRAGVGRGSLLAAVSARPGGWETFRLVPTNTRAQTPGRNRNGSSSDLNTRDLYGNYRISHLAADNGFLVRLGGEVGRAARLSIDNTGKVRASAGCNSMSARIRVRAGRSRVIEDTMSTMMRCVLPAQSVAERGISNAIKRSSTVERQGREVVFKNHRGEVLMRLIKT